MYYICSIVKLYWEIKYFIIASVFFSIKKKNIYNIKVFKGERKKILKT